MLLGEELEEQSDFERMTVVWMNEKSSSDLFPFEESLIERLTASIEHQVPLQLLI
jgi:hypothetical protein